MDWSVKKDELEELTLQPEVLLLSEIELLGLNSGSGVISERLVTCETSFSSIMFRLFHASIGFSSPDQSSSSPRYHIKNKYTDFNLIPKQQKSQKGFSIF